MLTVNVEAQLSTEVLLEAVEQLSPLELDEFANRILALRARQWAIALSEQEAELLLEINKGISVDLQRRYDDLIEKRRDEILTPDEYEELLRLTDRIEAIETRRVENLTELARLRGVPLSTLMDELEITAPVRGE